MEKFLQNIKPRGYQQKIFETCKEKNCLVVLPTGLGKTLIALMLTIDRMIKFPGEKVLLLAPTKPLAEQQLKSFKKNLPELFGEMQLFTGQTNAPNRKKIWQTADIIFSTPQCIEGDTLIFTREGPIKISEWFKKFKFQEENYKNSSIKIANIKEKVLGYDGKKISFVNASKALKIQTKEIIKIKTELGNTLNCTKDHPLLTINPEGKTSWKQASQLKIGDYIASAKKIDIKESQLDILDLISSKTSLRVADKSATINIIKKIRSSKYSRYYRNYLPIKLFLELSKKLNLKNPPETLIDHYGKSDPIKIPLQLNSKLAYILGAMLGEGHIGNRKNHGGEVVFSDLDRPSVNIEFENAIKEIFGIEMKKESKKGLIAYNSALAIFLNTLGIPKGNKSNHLKIPKFLFFANQESVKGFIKGIFDADGHASKYSVSISSANERFIKELKWLFLRIGILGNIEKRINKGNIEGRKIKESELFTFRFSGRENIKEFLRVSPDKHKCKKLIETLNTAKAPETRSKEILPIPELMKKIRKENRGIVEDYKFLCLSTNNLKKLSKKLKGKNALKLRKLLDMPIRWVKIKEKQKNNEKQEVYDLTIEKTHNFIANWTINHNCIANDLKKNLYNLEEVCLLIEDEAHRCIKNYDYNFIAQKYKSQSRNPRILGLTASPGSDAPRIKQICRNLSIEEVELRTRESPDVEEYLQELDFEKIMLNFPPELEEIRHVLKKIFNDYIEELRYRKVLFGPATKTELLKLQKNIMGTLSRGNKEFNYLLGASACAQAIKIQHALELLETQTISSFNIYLEKLFEQAQKKQSNGVVKLVSKPEFNYIYTATLELLSKKKEHPKLAKIMEIIEREYLANKNFKIIIFTQFRDTSSILSKKLNEIEGIKSKVFVGQAKKSSSDGKSTGLNQKEQKKIIEEFSAGEINILCATCIAEEGLDIPEVNAVIFYEPIPSAIRSIQRRGRTARLMKGKLIMLITKGTRDETFYYVSKAREKKMHSAITQIKKDLSSGNLYGKKEEQKTL